MTLLSIALSIREAWDALFVSRLTLFLEAENARLRAQVVHLQLKIDDFGKPIQAAPANKEDIGKVPQRTGGFQFWDADLAKMKRKELFATELPEVEENVQETVNV